MNRYVIAIAVLCAVYHYTASESQVQNRIACIRGKLPSQIIQSTDTCCTKQEKGCSARWGYFRTAMLCGLNATTAATGQSEFDGIRTTCSSNPKNNNYYKVNDCIIKDYERKCTTRTTTKPVSG